MTTETELKLETSRIINAPRDRLFDAWLDPEMLSRFMTPGPDVTVAASGGGFWS